MINDMRCGNFPWRKVFLGIECLALFFILPAVLFFFRHWVAWRVTPLMLLLAVGCCGLLTLDRSFNRKRLWDTADISAHIRKICLTFVVPAFLIGLFTFLFQKVHFLYFPRAEPGHWLAFIVLYPLLAVYPQEVVFRAFFFHRYKGLFSSSAGLILMNGFSFGLAHLLYANPFAPVLAGFGGMLFAYRYIRSGSVMASAIEHGLWGNFLFTVGMGWYFYSGSIR